MGFPALGIPVYGGGASEGGIQRGKPRRGRSGAGFASFDTSLRGQTIPCFTYEAWMERIQQFCRLPLKTWRQRVTRSAPSWSSSRPRLVGHDNIETAHTEKTYRNVAHGPIMHIFKSMAKKRILFIDDEYLLREVIYEMLSEMDYEVKVEETGKEAVKTFTEHPEEFDLVLTDLMMLDMTGDRIAERINSIRPDIPVVVMTGTPDALPRSKAKAAGVCRVLPKPLTKAELHEGLQRALSHDC